MGRGEIPWNEGKSENKIIAIPFGKLLIAVVIPRAFFFPGTRDNVTVSNPTLTERVKKDGFALTVYPNPETGIASGIATLVKLERIVSLDNSSFQLTFSSIRRVRITDVKHIQDLSGNERLSELLWEFLEEEEISSKQWNQPDIKEQVVFLQKAVGEVLERAPDALEQRQLTILKVKEAKEIEQARSEKIIGGLVAVLESLKHPSRELFGLTLDIVANALFELYYVLKEEKPEKEALKLTSNIFHTVMVEERLRRLCKFVGWFLFSWEQILDGDEAEDEEDESKTLAAAEKGDLPPNIRALLERYKIVKNYMPEEAQKEVEQGFSTLVRKPSNESSIEARLTWILFLPWEKRSTPPADLREVERILNEDHFGLTRVKNRVLEYLAVHLLNPRAKGKVLCFVGPKGVGKTSLGKSIARSLGKKLVRLALGGLDDVSDLRGHHHTYHNAAPGFIIQLIRQAGERDCVFMLDEIDKVEKNWRGDPSSALLEILDPEQNNQFQDHFLGVPFNLSEILFITTANIAATIHSTLQDRLEIIEIPGYTPLEKLEIAKKHLIPRRRSENGFPISIPNMPACDVQFSDDAILKIVNNYTREAGVRNLERELDAPFRKVARAVASQDPSITGVVKVSENNLIQYCGKPKFSESPFPEILLPGQVPILAVSDTGGHVFMIEVEVGYHPGRRKIVITGVRESGESKDAVNKIHESLTKAYDALASKGGILLDTVRRIEQEGGPLLITGNITNGAIPKDGPSAGLSIFLAVYGALTGKSIKPTTEIPLLACTGEIELKLDKVGEIGGLRDKILAASRFGIRRCFIPQANEKDIEDIPAEIRSLVEIIPIFSRWDALMTVYPEDRETIATYLANRNRSS